MATYANLKHKISKKILTIIQNDFLNPVQLHDHSTKHGRCTFFSLFFFFQIFMQQIVHSTYTLTMEFEFMCFIAQISFTLVENVSIKSKLPIRFSELLNV